MPMESFDSYGIIWPVFKPFRALLKYLYRAQKGAFLSKIVQWFLTLSKGSAVISTVNLVSQQWVSARILNR